MGRFAGALMILALAGVLPPAAQAAQQAAVVGAEISTFARHLQMRPQTALDFSDVSGEYCFNLGLGRGGHMTHYAIDPESTQEDVIDFVHAGAFREMGINVEKLPRFPGALGGMKPRQWYFLPAGTYEPHHGTRFPFALLIRADNLE
ncbi:MAG: hypothetical protein GWN84_14825 [Gammaproteobacteria bacterium]|nr:hypothetical protein [Gammaproteobacteria bacterium]NIR84073.1 hypothetical protein [Gammaproteobacteria bacterium]NIR89217.1 hypothetical protein [Gammaproteobacteria bacterium]NIU05019.1 hypothetical protein [Gammaproteobacteria bacterium]NIV52185.1 hypothetical protein [Gammaproteobacteria bacterium]